MSAPLQVDLERIRATPLAETLECVNSRRWQSDESEEIEDGLVMTGSGEKNSLGLQQKFSMGWRGLDRQFFMGAPDLTVDLSGTTAGFSPATWP